MWFAIVITLVPLLLNTNRNCGQLFDLKIQCFNLNLCFTFWWRVKDLNLRRQSRGIYSPLPLAARATRQGHTSLTALW